jgi:ribosomal protein L18E
MIFITPSKLEELDACLEGYEAFISHWPDGAYLSQALESNGLEDVLWYLVSIEERGELCKDKKIDLRESARKQALINIEKIEPYCKEGDYQLITSYLITGDESIRSAARSAAWSAARSAAWSAARSAAWSVAESARSAAWSAAESARSAAWSAAGSAARSAAKSAAWSAESELKEIFLRWEGEEGESSGRQ